MGTIEECSWSQKKAFTSVPKKFDAMTREVSIGTVCVCADSGHAQSSSEENPDTSQYQARKGHPILPMRQRVKRYFAKCDLRGMRVRSSNHLPGARPGMTGVAENGP